MVASAQADNWITARNSVGGYRTDVADHPLPWFLEAWLPAAVTQVRRLMTT